MNEDTMSTDTSTTDSSSAIENFDFSKPDGGLLATEEQQEDSSTTAATDEADQQDDAEQDQDEQDEQSENESGSQDDISKMSEKERNNYFAQRRIAEQQSAKEADATFLGQLRDNVKSKYIDVEPDEQAFENMDPDVAEMLRQTRQNERMREAERAIERIASVRDNTRLSILQAESSIPMFNPASDSYDEFFHEEALSGWAHRYAEVANGPDGKPQIVGVKDGAPTPLEYLQTKAPEYEKRLKAAQVRGQQLQRRNVEQADVASSNSITTAKSNSMQSIEDRIGNITLDSF